MIYGQAVSPNDDKDFAVFLGLLHPEVSAKLRGRRDAVRFFADGEDEAIPTGRDWEILSKWTKADKKASAALVLGLRGTIRFQTVKILSGEVPDSEDPCFGVVPTAEETAAVEALAAAEPACLLALESISTLGLIPAERISAMRSVLVETA